VLPQRHGAWEESFVIPNGYGDHRIVLMVKDPWWLFAYWEIQPAVERRIRSQLAPEEVGGLQSILRVYDVTDLPTAPAAQAGRDFPTQPAHRWMDIPLSGLANNWYLHVNAPNRAFIVDIGLLTKAGRFFLLARSNRVMTPRAGPSDIVDEEWMVADEAFWRLFGVTAGIGMGSSPLEIRRLLEQKLFSRGLFSPGFFSPGVFGQAPSQAKKDFSLWVNAELIVHGGITEPKATVTIQGESVPVKADGTFSVRMALPEGTQAIPVEATSPDGQRTQQITPQVTLQTEGRPAAPPRRAHRAAQRPRRG